MCIDLIDKFSRENMYLLVTDMYFLICKSTKLQRRNRSVEEHLSIGHQNDEDANSTSQHICHQLPDATIRESISRSSQF